MKVNQEILNKSLFKNTIMLYILALSNYFFGFISVPYLTRVLGPEVFGKIGFATAFSIYIQLVLDFGFILSATANIANNKNDNVKLSKIITAVTLCKLILIFICCIIVFFILFTIQKFNNDIILYVLFFFYVSVNSLLPDFLYRGLEKMTIITVRTVIVKMFFTICIFIFVKEAAHYILVPFFYLLGSIGAIIAVFTHVNHKLELSFVRINIKEIKEAFTTSAPFFVSRIASSVYSTTNTIILGFIYPVGNMVGFYSASEKLITTGKSAIIPVSDSLYPYMVRTKNYKLMKNIILIGETILIIGCVIVGIFAPQVCVLLFGSEYMEAANVLRCLLPLIVIALPSYLLGYPALTPLGLVKYANISVVIGSMFQLAILIILYINNLLNIYSVIILTCITELIVLSIRISVVFIGLKKNNRRT